MATRSRSGNRRRRHPSGGDEDLPKRLREDGNGEGSSSGEFAEPRMPRYRSTNHSVSGIGRTSRYGNRRYLDSYLSSPLGGPDADSCLPRVAIGDFMPPNFSLREYSTDDKQDNKEAKDELEKEALRVTSVDFNIAENSVAHHTDKYELTEQHRYERGQRVTPQLVVRRGQPFDIKITFDRAYSREKDELKLVFNLGPAPSASKGTSIVMNLSDYDAPKQWGAKVVNITDNTMTMKVYTPATCPVGKWDFKFDTFIKSGENTKVFRYSHPHPVYMIFNPWNPDDQVFMDGEDMRNEYVLNDNGKIYAGTAKQVFPKPWNFGQFEDFMLDCAFHLLDVVQMGYRFRGNPVLMVRKISAVVNQCDDNGVLVGNWSGDYSGGTSPLAWVGSVAILQEFWKTLKPVSFGQCWVFSGVVTTVCRTLGIPTRSVTNFASAHDTDGSITIDAHWTADGKPLEEYNDDSVWNFHVWNDVWMARPDLPSGFGGWQAVDATPQETSDGVYCAGPASLEAIKNGLVTLPYDAPFIFAEVNADRVHWIQKPDGNWGKHIQKNSVGKCIYTKSANSEVRQEIKSCYKFPEGSQQERTAVWRASDASSRQDVYERTLEDVTFELIEKEEVLIGKPFEVAVKVKNTSTEHRTVKGTVTASVVYYTGVPKCQVKALPFKESLNAGQESEVLMQVTALEYLDWLVDLAQLRMHVLANVEETKQVFADQDDFRLIKPDIAISYVGEVKVGQKFNVEVKFKNPLNKNLTKCEWMYEGPGLQKPMRQKQPGVAPNAEVKITFCDLVPTRSGRRELVVGFNSKELADVCGSCEVEVKHA